MTLEIDCHSSTLSLSLVLAIEWLRRMMMMNAAWWVGLSLRRLYIAIIQNFTLLTTYKHIYEYLAHYGYAHNLFDELLLSVLTLNYSFRATSTNELCQVWRGFTKPQYTIFHLINSARKIYKEHISNITEIYTTGVMNYFLSISACVLRTNVH